ncbi:hypothetical protein ACNA4F_25745, partial [Klebsiella pneumoniae]
FPNVGLVKTVIFYIYRGLMKYLLGLFYPQRISFLESVSYSGARQKNGNGCTLYCRCQPMGKVSACVKVKLLF